jgi:hypothetical protein
MLVRLHTLASDFRPWKPSQGRVFTTRFALDVETTPILGPEPPDFVLAAAADGARGVFLTGAVMADFLTAHWGAEVIFHNGAFDLGVLDRLFQARSTPLDVYRLVDERKVRDTLILHRLYGLATLGHTHQGKGQATLERCAERYLGVPLPKDARDADGDDVRLS